jgi:peptide/nickel transport system ATP-binding protein
MTLLNVENLRVRFRMGRGSRVAYAEGVGRGDVGVSFAVPENSTVALVGESGSGKSVTAMSILNLLPDNAERHGGITSPAATCWRPRCRSCRPCAGARSPACSRTR